MKKFNNVGNYLRRKRRIADLSQEALSHKLGYKNGQFISNVERGLCSIPTNKIHTLSRILQVSAISVVDVMIEDEREFLVKHLAEATLKEMYTL